VSEKKGAEEYISDRKLENEELHNFYSSPSIINIIIIIIITVTIVRERTIPTERPPLVSEVSANFCG
jgi:hypothetical protein